MWQDYPPIEANRTKICSQAIQLGETDPFFTPALVTPFDSATSFFYFNVV
jgi:hypothetical protein